MTFKPDSEFNPSHKMGDARINYNYAIGKFGEGDTSNCDGKCSNHWSGSFTAKDGTVMRASFWDWKGGLKAGYGVSIWVSNGKYLDEFKKWIEG